MQFSLTRNQPMREPFSIGLIRDTEANRVLMASMDPHGTLRLPPGTWELTAKVDAGPNGGDCQGEIRLQASTQVVVR
jgi:hypothetical protein